MYGKIDFSSKPGPTELRSETRRKNGSAQVSKHSSHSMIILRQGNHSHATHAHSIRHATTQQISVATASACIAPV